MGMTMVQKILARGTGQECVNVGDVVEPKVDLAMSHENAALVINQFNEVYKDTGLDAKVWDPSRIAIIFDHRVPAESSKTATNQKKVRDFVGKQGIQKFHDIRGDEGGICHQILPENGYVRPGFVVVGTDSHTTSHGALGAFSFGIGATEMASVWTLGSVLNVEVPGTIKVVVNGDFQRHVLSKDLILHLIGKISAEGANFKVIEFHGPAIQRMSTSSRLVICNMSVEAGATSGIVPPDRETRRYLHDEARVKESVETFGPDPDAAYDQTIEIDASALSPQIACPHTVDNVKPIQDVVGIKVNQIVIGSCTNGRLDDLEVAAEILRGRKVARGTRMLVFPASSRIYLEALQRGYVADLMKAGAVVMNSGCGPCLGVHQGAIADGDVALATTNRNFKGRMGNPNSDVYLCSPAVAAASALTGVITDPTKGGI
ncbi:MAG: 3-isopropylmalate dehydratase large subunit [Acidobacteriota bacterium]